MSKNNRLRFKQKGVLTQKEYRTIQAHEYWMWLEDYWVSKHYRSFKTWKHNRKTKWKQITVNWSK